MIPTYLQIVIIVILIVPGFATIKIYQKLIPVKKENVFDLTVSSIVLTLFIHGVYTSLIMYKFNDKFNTLMKDYTVNKTISSDSAMALLIYFIVLIVLTIVIGVGMAVIKKKGYFYKTAKKLGFQTSNFDNLWYELMFLYDISNETPYVIIEFEDIIYAGAVSRSAFAFGNSEEKEITLVSPRVKKHGELNFKKAEVDLIYLDLKEVKSVKFYNSDKLTQ